MADLASGACNCHGDENERQGNRTRLRRRDTSVTGEYEKKVGRTRYIGRRLNLATVNARIVALRKPQHELAKLIIFLVRLSLIPTVSKNGARK